MAEKVSLPNIKIRRHRVPQEEGGHDILKLLTREVRSRHLYPLARRLSIDIHDNDLGVNFPLEVRYKHLALITVYVFLIFNKTQWQS